MWRASPATGEGWAWAHGAHGTVQIYFCGSPALHSETSLKKASSWKFSLPSDGCGACLLPPQGPHTGLLSPVLACSPSLPLREGASLASWVKE